MEESPHRSSPRLLVFTDLDATLLDDSYSWAPATSAIERLKGGQHCLVLSSSKTLAEMRALALELELDAPLVAENGAAIAIPERSSLLEASDEGPVDNGFVISTQGASRPDILRLAHDLRETAGYAFSGFADWDAQGWQRERVLVWRAQCLPSIDTVPSRLSGKTVPSVGRPLRPS